MGTFFIIRDTHCLPFLSQYNSIGPFTANFPNNDAFADMNQDRLEFLAQPENIDELREVLRYHLIAQETLTDDFEPGLTDTLLPEFPVDVSFNPGIKFDDANVPDPDNLASNGVLNILDGVLDPFFNHFCAQFDFGGGTILDSANSNILEVARENPELSVIVSLFEAADLDPIFECPGTTFLQR